MTAELMEIVGTALGGGVVGGIATAVVNWRKAGVDARKNDDDAAAKREAAFVAGMKDLACTLQSALDARTKGEGTAIAAHTDCLKLVGELSGRVESLEVLGQRTELALDDCKRLHESTTSDLRRSRERIAALEKKASGDGIAAQSKESP